jgi:demethylsterigmatocystin 6-O-methyltransferase
MTSESVLLIDEMILPERDVPWRAAQLDILMACMAAAKERTQAEWETLFVGSGLRIMEILNYSGEHRDCLIVAVLK